VITQELRIPKTPIVIKLYLMRDIQEQDSTISPIC
jgi:hypothetical protein